MATLKDLDATVTMLVQSVESLKKQSTSNGWAESANMVLAEIKRQGVVLDRHDAQLQGIRADIATRFGEMGNAIISAQNDTHRLIVACEHQIATIEARCSDRAEKHADAATQRRDIWTEINKLRDWVKQVNDAGLVDQTEGRVRWPWIGAIGGFGGLAGWGIGEFLMIVLKGLR